MVTELIKVSENRDKVLKLWKQLSEKNSHYYFLSYGWIKNWISTLPADLKLYLWIEYKNNIPIAGCFLGNSRSIRNKIILSNAWHLNATGIKEYDFPLWVEYNEVLGDSNNWQASLNRWDEVFFPGLYKKSLESLTPDLKNRNFNQKQATPAYQVDLNQVRKNENGHLGLLSRNTRSQLKRAMKICSSTYGDLKVEKAQTKSGAFEFLDELLVLHRARAKELDRQSNFDTDYGHKFHTELINNRFDHQELDFLRVTAGNTLVGVLYNLNYQGRVYFFQSGIRSESDNKLKPGMICHHLAIQYYAEDEKNKIYDFLAGPERYKKSLSTQDELIYWYVLQKNHLRFKLEKAIISNLKKRK